MLKESALVSKPCNHIISQAVQSLLNKILQNFAEFIINSGRIEQSGS